MTLYFTSLYYVILYYTIFHYIILYYIPDLKTQLPNQITLNPNLNRQPQNLTRMRAFRKLKVPVWDCFAPRKYYNEGVYTAGLLIFRNSTWPIVSFMVSHMDTPSIQSPCPPKEPYLHLPNNDYSILIPKSHNPLPLLLKPPTPP